ncbi:restriction endonuclease subunit S [Psychromonas aquatilis]|uniref:Restriction endonuclease subunit S n=1 Tax=Psychromonas aquatilis TaxID=2005072 RepID=A0ABU9GRY8_9GAMM
MGSNWQQIRLGEFASHQKGFAFKSKDYVDGGVGIVRVSNLTHDSIDTSDLRYISIEKTIDKGNFVLSENDVIIATVGSWPKNPASVVGKVIKVPKSCNGFLLNQNAVRFKVKTETKYDQQYLYSLLKSKRFSDYIIATAQGSANQASITIKDIYAFEFYCPPEDVRRGIAKQLNTLERKIELNQQTNQTLEKMAQTLFKSWFVDFDPVFDNALAKADFNLENLPSAWPAALVQRATSRLQVLQDNPTLQTKLTQHNLAETENNIALTQASQAENTHQHFPSEFEPTDEPSIGINGWVPKGWSLVTFESLINLTGGGTPKTSIEEYWNGDIPWFSVVDAPNDSDVFVVDTDKHVTKLGVEKSSTKILRSGTTIISARGTVGKCALVATPMAMNQSCYGINGKNDISDEFIYFLTRYQVSDLQKRGHGSVFNTITRETFKSINLPFSGELLTNKFSTTVSLLFEKVLNNNMQNIELIRLRDTLLPKLISGELQIPSKTESI